MVDQFIGQHIGDYVITYLIARGGMARIYHAIDPTINHEIALKLTSLDALLGDGMNDPRAIAQFCERFHKEARIVASLEHLHILTIYGYDVLTDAANINPYADDGTGLAYIAMRYMRGGSLEKRVSERGAIPLADAKRIFDQIAGGLEYAHSKGVIHCDLKPSNILLDDDDNAYLADFGLARLLEGASSRSSSGENMVGTPAYLAPEQIRCDQVDERTDVYSLGLILYEMLTGQPAFSMRGGSLAGLITKQLKDMPTPAHEINPTIPLEIQNVIARAIAKDPEMRYANVAALSDALDAAMPIPAPDPEPIAQRAFSWMRTWAARAAILTMGVILSAIFGLGIVLASTADRPAPPPEVPQTFTFSPESILTGSTGTPEDAVPTRREIDLARAALGSDGFIAFVTCSSDQPDEQAGMRELLSYADEYHLAIRFFDGGGDTYTQITQVESARMGGAKAIILCVISAPLLEATLNAAQSAGIPIVSISRHALNAGVIVQGRRGDSARMLQTAFEASVTLLGGGEIPHILYVGRSANTNKHKPRQFHI
jgi:serine/threonine protein kinase